MSFGVSWNTNQPGAVVRSSVFRLETPLEDAQSVVGLKRTTVKPKQVFDA